MNVLWPEAIEPSDLREVIAESLEVLGVDLPEFSVMPYSCVLVRADNTLTYAGKILVIYDSEGKPSAAARLIFGQYISSISGTDQAQRLAAAIEELREASVSHESDDVFRPVFLLAPQAGIHVPALSKRAYRNVAFVLGHSKFEIEETGRQPFLQTEDEFRAFLNQTLEARRVAFERALAMRPDNVRGLPA